MFAINHAFSVVKSFTQINQSVLVTIPLAVNNMQQKRNFKANKHFLPFWKPLRRLKVVKIKLPDLEERDKMREMTPDQIRLKMKEKGLAPHRPWLERNFDISATGAAFEPYVPPEGDGKASYISTQGVKQTAEFVQKKGKSWKSLRKIRTYEEDFEKDEFAQIAQDIYINVHKAVAAQDKYEIRNLVTELMYPEVVDNMMLRTIRWNFLQTIEPPKVVHARCTDVISKENIFGQVTCRFFTKQTLAIYDRFGRLAHGSEVVAKDVLEYVVFEKHMSNQYGTWRVHTKILPPWVTTSDDYSPRTFVFKNSAASAV